MNNITVGRSVFEALRLLEAFQAVAKYGVLCPVDWKPSNNTQDTLATISNTLTESYEERLKNLQKEFRDTVIADLDMKYRHEAEEKKQKNYEKQAELSRDDGKEFKIGHSNSSERVESNSSIRSSRKVAVSPKNDAMSSSTPPRNGWLSQTKASMSSMHSDYKKSSSAPASPNATPTATTWPCQTDPPAPRLEILM